MDYMKKFPYWGTLNIRCHGTKFCHQHDLAPKICALLRWLTLMYKFSLQTFILHYIFLLGERTWVLGDLILIPNFIKIIELVVWGCTDTRSWYIRMDSCCHTYCASVIKYSDHIRWNYIIIYYALVWQHAATQPHNKWWCNFTECFNINITLAMFSASSLMMGEDRNMQEQYLSVF